MKARHIRELIRDVPDFPKPGIVFKDITPVLADPEALRGTLELMAELAGPLNPEIIAGPESRGFIFGTGLASVMGLGFVPIRKPGKLPWRTRSVSYELEYGTDSLEIHEDAVFEGQRVIIVDDLLATGGTMAAACELIEGLRASVVGCLFLVELAFLKGRDRIAPRPAHSIIDY